MCVAAMHVELIRTSRRRPLQEVEVVVHAALLSARGYGGGCGEPGASLSDLSVAATLFSRHKLFASARDIEQR